VLRPVARTQAESPPGTRGTKRARVPGVRTLSAPILALLAGCMAPATASPDGPDERDHRANEQTLTAEALREHVSGAYAVVGPLPGPVGRVGAHLVTRGGVSVPVEAAASPDARWTELAVERAGDRHRLGSTAPAVPWEAAHLRIPADRIDDVVMLRWTVSASLEPGDPMSFEAADGLGATLPPAFAHVDLVRRADWGARPAACADPDPSQHAVVVHGTATPSDDPIGLVRSIQRYHQDSRGWCDIGYHFLIGRDGRLWPGREELWIGAHVGGANTGNVGIAFMGTHTTDPVQQVQIDETGALMHWVAQTYAIPANADTVKGHRDFSATICPGDGLYPRIPELIDRMAGEPVVGCGTVAVGTDASPTALWPLLLVPALLAPRRRSRG